MDHLQEMLPPEARAHPMATMLLTFLREAKRDIKRMPEPFIYSLSKVIGEAFTWVAEGDINTVEEDNPFESDEMQELLSNV